MIITCEIKYFLTSPHEGLQSTISLQGGELSSPSLERDT